MIIQFQTHELTLLDQEKAYFEKRLKSIEKFLGKMKGDDDSTILHVNIQKVNHKNGARFEAKAHLSAPHGGNLYADVEAETLKALADKLKEILDRQARKFHTKHLGS